MKTPASWNPVIVVLLVLAAAGTVRLWSSVQTAAGIDFYQFWVVPQAVAGGIVDDIYDGEARLVMASVFHDRAQDSVSARFRKAASFRKDEIQAAGTPFLYTCFGGLVSGNYDLDLKRFQLLSLVASICSVLVLCRGAGHSLLVTLSILNFVLWVFDPLRSDLIDGNINQIQLACLASGVWMLGWPEASRTKIVAGLVVGLAIMLKPNLAIVAVCLGLVWLIHRRRRALLLALSGLAGAVGLAVATSSMFFGTLTPWARWIGTVPQLPGQFDVSVAWGNFGGAMLLHDLTGLNLAVFLHVLLLAVVVLASFRVMSSRLTNYRADQLLCAIAPMIAILASPLAWPHYLVLALPLAICLLRRDDTMSYQRLTAVLVVIAMLLCTMTPLLRIAGIKDAYIHAAVLLGGSLLLFCVGCWRLYCLPLRRGSA